MGRVRRERGSQRYWYLNGAWKPHYSCFISGTAEEPVVWITSGPYFADGAQTFGDVIGAAETDLVLPRWRRIIGVFRRGVRIWVSLIKSAVAFRHRVPYGWFSPAPPQPGLICRYAATRLILQPDARSTGNRDEETFHRFRSS